MRKNIKKRIINWLEKIIKNIDNQKDDVFTEEDYKELIKILMDKTKSKEGK